MADAKFTASLDTKEFKKGADSIKEALGEISDQSSEVGDIVDALVEKFGKGMAAAGISMSVAGFVKSVAEVRGQTQQLEVAFNTMLGSKEKAEALMAQLTQTAATTPFDLTSVSQGAKQLIAYGESAETVNDTLVKLGNIASGIGAPLNDITYLYGTTMTQGRLYTNDLNQFTGRGIPMIKLLAEQFGVAENEVKGLVEAGKVGFPQVQTAINQLTQEGGMFFNLMEEQSKTITGKISNLGDALDGMFNDIGKYTQDYITGALDTAISLVENYQSVGEALGVLIGTYGAYRAALIVTAAVQKAKLRLEQEVIVQTKLAAMSNITLSNAEAVAAAKASIMANAQKKVVASLNKVKAAIMTNPYALLAAAVVAAGYGIYKLVTYQSDYEKSVSKMNTAKADAIAKTQQETEKLDGLVTRLRDAKDNTDEYKRVKDEIVDQFGKYNQGLEQELTNVENIDTAYENLKKKIQDFFDHKAYLAEKDRINSEYQEKRTEALKDLYDELQGDMNLTDAEGSELYKKLTEGLSSGQVTVEYELHDVYRSNGHGGSYLAKEYERVVKGLDEETQALFNKWRATDGEVGKIEAISDATKDYEKELAKLNDMFANVKDMQDETGGGEEQVTQLETLEGLIKKITEAEKKLADARSKSQRGEVSTDEVSDSEKQLANLKAQYKLMTGKDYGSTDKGGGGGESDAVKAAREERKRLEEELQAKQDMENAARQLEIDGMQEGLAKRIAAIELATAKERQALDRQRRQWEEAAKQQIETQTGKAYAGQEVRLSEVKSETLAKSSLLLDEKTQLAITQELAGQYQSIVERAVNEAAKTQGDLSVYEKYGDAGKVAEVSKQGEETQNKLGTEYFQQDEKAYEEYQQQITQLCSELVGETLTNKLEEMIAMGEARLAELQGESLIPTGEMLKVRGQLQMVKTALKDVKKGGGDTAQTTTAEWKKLGRQLAEAGGDIKSLGESIDGAAGDILEVMGDVISFAANSIDSITTIVDQSCNLMAMTAIQAGESIKTVEKASVILAIISAALQLIQGIVSIFKGDDYMDEVLKKVDELNDKIDETLYKLRSDDSQFDNMFGTNSWAKLVNNATLANEALTKYNDTISSMANDDVKVKVFGIEVANLGSYRDMLGEVGKEMTDFEVAQNRISNMRVQTRHSTWFRSAKYSSIADLGIGLDENLGTEEYMAALREFADSDLFKHLDDEDQEFINNALDGWEKYQEAIENVQKQFSDWFGDIQSSLGDSIRSAFEEGTDAAESFRQAVGDKLRAMVMDLLVSKMVGPIFEKAGEEISKKMVDSGGDLSFDDINDIKDIVVNAADQATALAPAITELYGSISKDLDAKGYKSESDTDVNGLSGAIAGASQESIDLLSGYCNAVRIQQVESIETQRQMLVELSGINVNTADTVTAVKKATEVLSSMNKDTLRASGL